MVTQGYRDGGGEELPGWDLQGVTRMEVALGARGPSIMVTQGYRDGGGQGLPGWGWPRVTGMVVAMGYWDGGARRRCLT
jgi:hypothetical protein